MEGAVNAELEQLAAGLQLHAPESRALALRFSLACAQRVEHLLEDPAAVDCLQTLAPHVDGQVSAERWAEAAAHAAQLANRHGGSKSIDRCGHAAVSASYGVAKAVAGRALDAAQYCAYASVYASGGSAAVADRDAFEPEFAGQRATLCALARAMGVGTVGTVGNIRMRP